MFYDVSGIIHSGVCVYRLHVGFFFLPDTKGKGETGVDGEGIEKKG